MQVSQILYEYVKKYPIYEKVGFSYDCKNKIEHLHPLLIITQYIIDSFIAKGEKRIAIVLPDNDCNIIPMILTKYFSNVLYDPCYSGSILDDIKIGQRLRLGKAIIEFKGIDKDKNRISFMVERANPMYVSCPISALHYHFEKCDGALSSYKTFYAAEKEAEKAIQNESNDIINTVKMKRTVLNKTILLLTAKNDFKEYTEKLKINDNDFSNIMSYGDIDINNQVGFNLYNPGRLDCLPALSITAKLEEIYYALKVPSILEKVFAIFSTVDKFDEIVANTDTLKKCLKKDTPFVVFVPESAFEDYPVLSELGFKMWHWKPSTMQSEAYLIGDYPTRNNSIFGNFSAKVDNAALAGFEVKQCKNDKLKINIKMIRSLSQSIFDADSAWRQLVRHLWAFQMRLTSVLCTPTTVINEQLEQELSAIRIDWQRQKIAYAGQQITTSVDFIINTFSSLVDTGICEKYQALKQFLCDTSICGKKIVVLVPDRYTFFDETKQTIFNIHTTNHVVLKRVSMFLATQNPYDSIDYLIVTWFEKDEYIRIKQTYCYDNLVYLLYDFENRWRDNFISRFDRCLPHESVKQNAAIVNISEDFAENPIDAPVAISIEDVEYKDIDDYETSKNIIRSTVKGENITSDSSDSVECIPVLLSGDNIAYFYPTHDVIDITALVNGDYNHPIKKEASRLRKGDKILVRHSGKDIIKEKADELMKADGATELREISAKWSDTLKSLAQNKTVTEVGNAIIDAGGDCTYQQVRYWLSGETICPHDKDIITCIAIIAEDNRLAQSINEVYIAGQRVQSYHQKAGIWLSRELKNKADAIKSIISDGKENIIEGIGDVSIYTIEEVLEKNYILRGKINKVEALY